MSRLRCPELRKLPKSTKITAIQWRNQTPGALDPLFTLGMYPANQLVDPTHPGANLKKAKFPFALRDDVGIRMLPVGLLLREERQFPAIPILTWAERVQKAREARICGNKSTNTPDIRLSKFQDGEQLYPEKDYNNTVLSSRNTTPRQPFLDMKLKKTEKRVPMSFHVATSKARMGSFRYQRKRLETRLRSALNLIVAKGAFHDTNEGRIGINMADSGRKWVMQGWAYMFYPTIKMNQMPYANLIGLLRQLLTNLNARAIRMENEWLNQSLLADEKELESKTTVKIPSPKTHTLGSRSIQSETSERLTPTKGGEYLSTELSANILGFSKPSETLQPKKGQPKKKTKPRGKENVSIQNLAGKAPKVWKKELMSGLALLRRRPSSGPNADQSKDGG